MSILYVISDTHISAGDLDDCTPEIEPTLCDFIKWISKSSANELVINGDFLDFVQADPWNDPDYETQASDKEWLCFTESQSVAKLSKIIEEHAAVFSALKELVDQGKRLVILPGNHDADFYWRRVQTNFVSAITKTNADRIRFCLDKYYRPQSLPVVVSHGHLWDSANRIALWSEQEPPIKTDSTGVPRLLACPGTRLLLNVINPLDYDYPFIDNMPLTTFLSLFGKSMLVKEFGPWTVGCYLWKTFTYLGESVFNDRTGLLDLEDSQSEKLRKLKNIYQQKPTEFQEGLRAITNVQTSIETHLEWESESFMDKCWANRKQIAELERATETHCGQLGLAVWMVENQTMNLRHAAKNIRDSEKVDWVIMGHTHEPIFEPGYVNTGSWIYNLNPQAKITSHLLSKSDSQHSHFNLDPRFAKISPTGVTLESFAGEL